MGKIVIASDHAGFKLKSKIKAHFADIDWLDLGTDNEDSVDYPDFGQALARAITNNEAETGVLICGSGIGISIAANRFAAVRAALCTSEEMAMLSRQHNNANVIVLGERIIDEATALKAIETFFKTEFEGGRHERRVNKMNLSE